jgi:hypothetical protein
VGSCGSTEERIAIASFGHVDNRIDEALPEAPAELFLRRKATIASRIFANCCLCGSQSNPLQSTANLLPIR